ncbi:MAG: amino acid ABC transporter permease [Acidimicrobiales bacterium]
MSMRRQQRARLARAAAIVLPLLLAALVGASADWARIQRAFFQPDVAADLFPRIVTVGVKNTLLITGIAFLGGLALGLLLALMRLSSIAPYRWIATAYIEVFRGIPALVTLILVGFAMPIALGFRIPGRYGAAGVGLSLVAAAYMAETIRAGIQAVPKGQTEAAKSLGMGPTRTLVSIVIPQAFRIIVPPLTNELVLLLKDSSLVYVLGTTADTIELSKLGRDAVSRSFNGTPITVVAILYLAITLPLTQVAARLERRGARSR